MPAAWRQAFVQRADLDRFLFAPEDVVVRSGRMGWLPMSPNISVGQPVLGVNPAPDLYDGVLVRRSASAGWPAAGRQHRRATRLERRTMVEATLDAGETLLALNEIFVGHRSHQSARYRIEAEGEAEDQSSSGLIVASGTGATGWARSIMDATHLDLRAWP